MIEEEFLKTLKKAKIDYVLTLPCERVKRLISLLPSKFEVLTLAREEEGVGISAGLYMGGKKPIMLIQSSGFGNCVNALMSLTKCYELPLPILISWRGVYGEKIEAQKPLGERLPKVLAALDIDFVIFDGKNFDDVENAIKGSFEEDKIVAILLRPDVWSEAEDVYFERPKVEEKVVRVEECEAKMTRYEALKMIKEELEGRIVVSNIGYPSRELYHILDQPTNFYMLGSMGLASSIALGVALTGREVISIDGDGSILMNPSTLFTAGNVDVDLKILAIDNAAYGSTGNQPTASVKADLQLLAISAGFEKTFRANGEEVKEMLKERGKVFIHFVAKPGNAKVPTISMTAVEIKERFMEAIR